jgi:hypothetical protein
MDHNGFKEYVEFDINSNDSTRVSQQSVQGIAMNGPLFMRIRRAGANIAVDVSRNRVTWTNYDTRAMTSVFTTAPDQVGLVTTGALVTPHGYVLHYLTGSL